MPNHLPPLASKLCVLRVRIAEGQFIAGSAAKSYSCNRKSLWSLRSDVADWEAARKAAEVAEAEAAARKAKADAKAKAKADAKADAKAAKGKGFQFPRNLFPSTTFTEGHTGDITRGQIIAQARADHSKWREGQPPPALSV
jgi:hypothetical protein